MSTDPFKTLRSFEPSAGTNSSYYSLPALEEQSLGKISRLPFSIRVVLESVLRNCDNKKVHEKDVRALAAWNAKAPAPEEIPFVVARIVLQDFTGVPLLVDLAAMRSAVARLGGKPGIIEPLVPVDLVVDHSVQVDYYGWADAMKLNLDMEFKRNRERYEFLKWGQGAFETFGVVPPGIGIVHQVNLEYLARGVLHSKNVSGNVYYPDSLVGTDSHTTMINGLGVVGWGVGGIEAEAGMLGQPVYFLTPEVVGVHLTGKLSEGVTATDLALRVTQMLRAAKVVGKFVEFYGEGAESLPLPDRATIANMAPEYGATMGIFPVDAESVAFLRATGRTEAECSAFENYFKAQGMFGMPHKGQIDYSVDLELDLSSVVPSVAGPKRPQDRIDLPQLKSTFHDLLIKPVGLGKNGKEIFLKDIWPSLSEIRDALRSALTPEMFTSLYGNFAGQNPKWNEISAPTGEIYEWDTKSTYIQEPPFFENFGMEAGTITPISGARALGIFGDSVTTDHISPAGAIKEKSPAGRFLSEHGVTHEDFNSYGSRRGNDRIMTRGTFANVRIKNLMLPGVEGGETLHQPDGERMSIFDASHKYQSEKTPLIIVAGQEYGTGSSRDWAAKGTRLLGVKAVIAASYERIHRSNLVGMGILPVQFMEETNAQSLSLDGTETYDIIGLSDNLEARQDLAVRITRKDGSTQEVPVKVRIDTPIEVDYYRHGGILPFILRQLINEAK